MAPPPPLPRFVHREIYRTVDSICTKCFLTVANADREEDLAQIEAAHTCNELDRSPLVHFDRAGYFDGANLRSDIDSNSSQLRDDITHH